MVRIGNFLFHYRNGLFPLAFVLLLWRGQPICENNLIAAGIGFGIAMLGQVLRALTIGLAYIIRGGRNRQVYAEDLVTGGLFAHCRNPLYVGNLLILAGVGVAANSLLFLAIGMPLFLFAYRAIVAAEENFLHQKFGGQFEDYCARVNRFLPNLAGLRQTLRGMEFQWQRLIVKEYGSTFAWTAGALSLVMKNLWLSGQYTLQSPLLWTLCGALLLVLVAYAVARYLKKSRILQAG
jgi:protein-S-isoprenylcysteine O-methyltransferase Ste14